jgi:2,3-bisphosphoglycerate-dependent phosphoglycerate mutase
MERLILARHGESAYSARGAVNGDPGKPCPLTDEGRAQARRLGELLADRSVDLCATSEFERTRETADLALAGRDVPRLVVPDLNDHPAGDYEGRPLADYVRWARAAPAAETIPGAAESRVEVAARFARGFRSLLARPEPTVLAVLHSLPLGYLLSGPLQRTPLLDYAVPYELELDEAETAVARLEAWSAAPSW